MLFPEAMMHDNIWFDRPKYDEARHEYQMFLSNNLTLQVSKPHEEQGLFERATTAVAQVAQSASSAASSASSALINEISEIRDTIKQSLSGMVYHTTETSDADSKDLRHLLLDLSKQVAALDLRVTKLEGKEVPDKEAAKPAADEDADDDFELFGDDSDDETEEEKAAAEKKKAELVAKYNEKKSKKTAIIAKSSILLDVKPWDDETDMKEMERLVRTIQMDGLVWGTAKLVEVGYGIKKLQIMCVVEDDKVGTDILEEEITKFEDLVQSIDVAAFNKI